VPFTQRFTRLTAFQKDAYFATFACTALATVLLIAPSAQHRILFRQRDKENLLRRSSRSAYAGLVVLALAIATALLLVLDVLVGRVLAWTLSAVVAAMLVWWWMAVPVAKRRTEQQDDPDHLDDRAARPVG
jgi:Flp pilus assembly protein TadB